jgi:hypothetical protein
VTYAEQLRALHEAAVSSNGFDWAMAHNRMAHLLETNVHELLAVLEAAATYSHGSHRKECSCSLCRALAALNAKVKQ